MPAPFSFHDVFSQLDRWRHLPNYQLERRADIFFALFIDSFVARTEQCSIQSVVVPEFPIKRDLIWPDHPSNKSVKVDYVLFAQDRSRVFFVELKTDADSRRDAQDNYLARSAEIGFRPILEGLLTVAKHSSAIRKYYHLLAHIAQTGFLSLAPEIEARAYGPQPSPPHNVFDGAAISPDASTATIAVRYLEPVATSSQSYSFAQFAEHLRDLPGDLAVALCKHLDKWTSPAANTPPPR